MHKNQKNLRISLKWIAVWWWRETRTALYLFCLKFYFTFPENFQILLAERWYCGEWDTSLRRECLCYVCSESRKKLWYTVRLCYRKTKLLASWVRCIQQNSLLHLLIAKLIPTEMPFPILSFSFIAKSQLAN